MTLENSKILYKNFKKNKMEKEAAEIAALYPEVVEEVVVEKEKPISKKKRRR